MFIVFDGIDGAGKSTQIERLATWLKEQNYNVVCCADPGTTRLGNHLRELLLKKQSLDISPISEMLMFMTARTQMVTETIRPSLDAGKVVICDRFVMATIVYQGHASSVDDEDIRIIGRIATLGYVPEMTFVLDLPVDEARRRNSGNRDRMESRGDDYFEKVRKGFLAEAALDPGRNFLIDASADADSVFESIRNIVESKLPNLEARP